MLLETKLPDFLIDLHAEYGSVFPRPAGFLIGFRVFKASVSFKKFKEDVEATLAIHGIKPVGMFIKPGPEVTGRADRQAHFSVRKSELI